MEAMISIHVLREEDDEGLYEVSDCGEVFQSTSSARRTTGVTVADLTGDFISIHVLREEDDPKCVLKCVPHKEFQSTSSARRTTNQLPG